MQVLVIISACAVAFAVAHPQQQQLLENTSKNPLPRETTTFIPIISYDNQQAHDGSYKTSYETGNHILSEETGVLRAIGVNKTNNIVQEGSYSYTSPEGVLINVKYVADETGFHATGDHIPTAPPVSAAIQAGLDLIYAGIKANAERAAKDPEFAKRQKEANFAGQYIQ